MVSDEMAFNDNKEKRGLNPCSNGIWSLTTHLAGVHFVPRQVLILVLMEYGLWLRLGSPACRGPVQVLILVLMEYGLWHSLLGDWVWSMIVLILVLMEYGLWRN